MVSVLFLSLGVAAVGLVVVLWAWGQLLGMVSCPFEKNLLECEDNGLRWSGGNRIDEGRLVIAAPADQEAEGNAGS